MSGLVDVEDPAAAALLLKSVPDLTAGNRKFALAGMLRAPARTTALLDDVERGTIKVESLDKDLRESLRKHEDDGIRTRAMKVLDR